MCPCHRLCCKLPLSRKLWVFVSSRCLGGAAAAPGEGKPTAATEVFDAAPDPIVNGWTMAACVDEATSAAAPALTHEDASEQVPHVGMQDITNVLSKGLFCGQRRRTCEAVGRSSDMELEGNRVPLRFDSREVFQARPPARTGIQTTTRWRLPRERLCAKMLHQLVRLFTKNGSPFWEPIWCSKLGPLV